MNKARFAELIGVSGAQVTKYGDAIVIDGGQVDVEASLANLEGRLDETKRQRALAVLGGLSAAAKPAENAPRQPSGKSRYDDARAQLAEIELAEKKGELLSAAEVEMVAYEAIAAMREAQAGGRREFADRLCADFGIDPSRAGALARKIAARDEVSLGAFSTAMAAASRRRGPARRCEPGSHGSRRLAHRHVGAAAVVRGPSPGPQRRGPRARVRRDPGAPPRRRRVGRGRPLRRLGVRLLAARQVAQRHHALRRRADGVPGRRPPGDTSRSAPPPS
jgi:hypothetical protein